MTGAVGAAARRVTPDGAQPVTRAIPLEAPIAVEFNGIGYAVMMATPANLEDFAVGFALSERLVGAASEVEAIDAHQPPEAIGGGGWILRVQIAPTRLEPLVERVRTRVAESSCGLCGLENLEQVNRPLPNVTSHLAVEPGAVFDALAALRAHQPLNAATGGAHAAAFCAPDGRVLLVREDVGRHCAFDKLIGAMARAGLDPTSGFALLSSRCSYELVEKAAVAQFPLLVTISTATSLAVARASAAGLRLIALARPDAYLDFAPELTE